MFKTRFKTSTIISIIFSIFTFFVVLFLILFINIFSYFNWEKVEKIEGLELKNNYNIEEKSFIEEQLETIELEIFLLFSLTFLAFVLSKYLFSKLILQDIFFISENLKNKNIDTIKKIKLNNNKDDEINIITNSINIFLDIIYKNTQNLKEFNSQVSHEFKTPLMIIESELEYLKLYGEQNNSIKYIGEEKNSLKNSYLKIENQVDNLNNLLESFILLSKIDNSKNIKKEKINLSKIIEEKLYYFINIYSEKNIIINNNIRKDIIIKSNKYYLDIVIKNLIDNAFKYNKNLGNIELNFENNKLKGNQGILKIKNSGKIIKKENIEKIFNNFYRENNFGEGYGIGLNLVKKIINILGYNIFVKSEKDFGTEFSIEL